MRNNTPKYYCEARPIDGTTLYPPFVGVYGTKSHCKKLVCGRYGYRRDYPNCDFVLVDCWGKDVEVIAKAKRK